MNQYPSQTSIDAARNIWENIARDGGWTLGRLHVWYDAATGRVTDSMGVREKGLGIGGPTIIVSRDITV